MSHPEPSIRVNVDVTNPGQFFACCGLLELADRLWPGAEGWFEDGEFCLHCQPSIASPNQIFSELLGCPEFHPDITKRSALAGSKRKLLPVNITFPESALKIDWWRDELVAPAKRSRETCAKSAFKTWSGNQSPQQIIYDRLLPALRQVMAAEGNWFHVRVSLSGRFGFDHTSAVKAIDVGWSPDAQNTTVNTSPAIELLAMCGLQRFRPASRTRSVFAYCTWPFPAAVPVAAALAAGVVTQANRHGYYFTIEQRGDYKYFSIADPLEI